jgi:hypothetical protein
MPVTEGDSMAKKAKAATSSAKAKTPTTPISLKATVRELDKATKELEKVVKKVEGREKQELTLAIKELKEARKGLTFICGGFPLWPPKRR